MELTWADQSLFEALLRPGTSLFQLVLLLLEPGQTRFHASLAVEWLFVKVIPVRPGMAPRDLAHLEEAPHTALLRCSAMLSVPCRHVVQLYT